MNNKCEGFAKDYIWHTTCLWCPYLFCHCLFSILAMTWPYIWIFYVVCECVVWCVNSCDASSVTALLVMLSVCQTFTQKKKEFQRELQTPHNTEVLKKHLKRPTLSTSSVRRYESKFLFNSKVCIKSVYGLFVPMFTFYWCQILIP